jgi:diguanylate cyclase (GGDEF)-like protein
MPSMSEIVLAAIGILATIAVALLLAPTFVWIRRRMDGNAEESTVRAEGSLDPQAIAGEAAARSRATTVEDPDLALAADSAELKQDPTLEDRVIRIVSWAFLMAVAVFAAASGVWPDVLAAIVILVAVTGEIMLILQDVLPRTPLKRIRGPLQGVLALVFASSLVALTGGLESPFTFTFPLIVGAGALLVAPRIALALAVLATAAYLAAGLVANPNPGIRPLVAMAVNLTGVYLLAYIGASVGREQRRTRDAAIRMSTVDSLTGLYNRSYLFAALEREIARGDRSGRAFCLVMLDLDDLKAVNDRFGHVAGDQVLRGVADVVRNGVRKIDTAARYGGDEFVAVLPGADEEGAKRVIDRLHSRLAEDRVKPELATSAGIAVYPRDGSTATTLLSAADRALYQVKAHKASFRRRGVVPIKEWTSVGR